jgi:membrane protease YdiL (CAAX protease family)
VTRRVAVVVWAGMLAVPFFFLFMASSARWGQARDDAASFHLWLALLTSAFTIGLSRLLPQRLGPWRTGREATAFTRLMIGWALCEAGALFPLLAWILAGDPRLIAVFALGLLALVALYPSDARWERLAPGPGSGAPGGR